MRKDQQKKGLGEYVMGRNSADIQAKTDDEQPETSASPIDSSLTYCRNDKMLSFINELGQSQVKICQLICTVLLVYGTEQERETDAMDVRRSVPVPDGRPCLKLIRAPMNIPYHVL